MIKIIIKKELKDFIKDKGNYLALILASLILVYLPIQLFVKIAKVNEQSVKMVDFYVLFIVPFVILYIAHCANYNLFAKEKITKTLHSLLATPLDLKTIWLGKSISITILGYFISIITVLAFILIINLYIIPVSLSIKTSTLLLPSLYGFISLFIINPIICLSLIGLIGILTFKIKDESKVRLIIFITLIGTVAILKQYIMVNLSYMIYYHLFFGVFIVLLAIFSTRFLNTEKIITQ